MKEKGLIIALAIGFVALGIICIFMGISWENEVNQLNSELLYYQNKPPKIIYEPVNNYDDIDTERALLELANEFAQMESANITIETPEARLHIEWSK